jgi:anti-sigma B factor antagonist
MPQPARLDVRDEGPVRIIRFQDRSLSDEATIRGVGDQLAAAIPRTGPPSVILDFSGVEMITSMMVGKLIALQRRVDNQHGQMRFCELSDPVRGVFRTANLDRLFALDRDLRQSREALGAEEDR